MSNISIVNLSAYTSPVIQENKKNSYIEYGSDNNYFQKFGQGLGFFLSIYEG